MVSSKYSFKSIFQVLVGHPGFTLVEWWVCTLWNRDRIANTFRSISGWTNFPYVCYRMVRKDTPKGTVHIRRSGSPTANQFQVTSRLLVSERLKMCALCSKSLALCLWACKNWVKNTKTLRENTGRVERSLENLPGYLRHKRQIGLGDHSKIFRKQRRRLSSTVLGGKLETIQVDCDSPGFGEWNYYSESWNSQLMKAKLTHS